MLKATQISKVYKTSRGEVTALAPCSLEFAESGLVLICGESGGVLCGGRNDGVFCPALPCGGSGRGGGGLCRRGAVHIPQRA